MRRSSPSTERSLRSPLRHGHAAAGSRGQTPAVSDQNRAHYCYSRTTPTPDGRTLRRAAVRRADWRASADAQERTARRGARPARGRTDPRRRHRHRPRRCPAGRARRPGHRFRRICGDARGRRSPGARGAERCAWLRARRRARAAVCRPRRSTRRSACACSCTRSTGGSVVAELCRVARWRVVIDFPALSSFAALESAARRAALWLGRRVRGLSRHRATARSAPRSRAHGFRDRRACERQFVLPIALHKAIGSAYFTDARRTIARRRRVVGLLGSPVTMVAERTARCAVLVTGATGFTGGHLARYLAGRGRRRAGARAQCRRTAPRVRWRADGIESCEGRSHAIARRLAARG